MFIFLKSLFVCSAINIIVLSSGFEVICVGIMMIMIIARWSRKKLSIKDSLLALYEGRLALNLHPIHEKIVKIKIAKALN